ncbi:aldehyde dehydrogenase family protein [Actinokineospora globicatena]|uniref:aldehyde dehydrogenase family protein n=1 Tax=Actinokineospora globicatena TaxID=103729 RepID=UPI0020A5B366|nr:aldehyde dehydrogenase family protein [Actinokineospora globicatena]MCP2301466.1 Acyl-CoA reductase [Actinokineospora globicatena]GLW76890.1 aldehyde dehydrogenase [Actinokineospora globicatena]GLW83723.1 aldehyde dehydrogenase [Actinokineospora globicatena]
MTFESLNPVTDEVVGTHPVHTAQQVDAAVARARTAAGWWADLGFAGRAERLTRWKGVLTRRAADLAEVVSAETGKPHADAMLEIILAVDHTAWAARNAPKVLGRKRRPSGLLMANQTARVEYLPLGVVGVIGPWNYPVFTPMGSIAYALAAGNPVVFKPSEYTPGVGQWLAETFASVVPEHPVFQLITGFGETGAALCRSGVDKIAFTGSPGTGKKIMATCAETLTPVLIEAGGKDALLVDSDADLEAAADAAVWGGISNAGQTCVGIERVYVHSAVYDKFVSLVVDKARAVEPGKQIGPITMPSQVAIIRGHIADALSRGGRALVGGNGSGRFVEPTVLVDVPEESSAVQEETFGPTLTVTKVASMDEAITKANNTRYGLGGAVFSRANGPALARRLRAGMVSINSVISFAGIPSLPFGGTGDSGFGRIHGPEGLREFARPQATTHQRFRAPLTLTSFTRPEKTDTRVAKLITLLHGRR